MSRGDAPSSPPNRLPLVRWPLEADPTLRAWDAADELLLGWLAGEVDTGPLFPSEPPAVGLGDTIVVNDAFGAVTLGLLSRSSTGDPQGAGTTSPLRVVADSVLSTEALRKNAERCDVAGSRWQVLSVDALARLPPASLGCALIKIPKSLGELEEALHRIRPALREGGVVVCAGMTRSVHTSTLALLDAIIGPTVSSHARKKARLVHAVIDPDRRPPPNPWPKRWTDFGVHTTNHAGVFSSEGLDQGARVLLEALPDLLRALPPDARDAVDLGCGNGVLGTRLALLRPELTVEFRDASAAAIRSAAATFAATCPTDEADFVQADGMDGRPDRSVDLIVCNPPFHARGARGDDTAWRMFTGAKRALRSGGQLWVVGNRHLAYAAKLKRLFGDAEVVTSHSKFVVVRVRR